MRQYRIEVRQAWWLKHYLIGVSLTSALTGLEPNPAKVEAWVCRGVVVRVVPVHAVLEA